jgi:predicted HTH transcriptional regulator
MTNLEPPQLLDSLIKQYESEYIEFKGSNSDPENIGQLISALANGAVLQKKDEAYLIYGVNDSREIVGTTFEPDLYKKNNQPFKNWLASNLSHAGALGYQNIDHPKGRVLIITIPRATTYPVKFKGVEYIRIGESRKKLSEQPELARKLWEEILKTSFEDGHASDLVNEEEVFELLDISPYFTLREEPVPSSREEIIPHLISDNVLVPKLGRYYITNLGALLFARRFQDFDSLMNRGVRLIRYKGTDKTVVERSLDGSKGYAIGINELINVALLLTPAREVLDDRARRISSAYPREVIRELAINMLLHQDFSVSGFAPRIEIYSDRIEFTNPGSPIIALERFLDLNRSRNPKLARIMRFMKLTEERGMGIDVVEARCEAKYLPSPSFMASDGFTRVTIFDHKTLRQFNSKERTNLVYMHCCLQHINHFPPMTNESLRSRFADDTLSSIVASRWINEALEKEVIKPFDPDSTSRRHASYIPFWA